MSEIPPFPVDDATLDMLEAAMDPWNHGHPEAESSSLWPLLTMLSQLAGSDTSAVEETVDDGSDGGAAIRVMRDPHYHEFCVIKALIAEVRQLRAANIELAISNDALTFQVNAANTDLEQLWDRVHQRLRYAPDWKLAINPCGIYGCVEAYLTAPSGEVHTNIGKTLTKRLAWALGYLPKPSWEHDAAALPAQGQTEEGK